MNSTIPSNPAATPRLSSEQLTAPQADIENQFGDGSIEALERRYGPQSPQAIYARDSARASHPSGGTFGAIGNALRGAYQSQPSVMFRGLANRVANAGPIPAGLAGGALGTGLGYGVGRILDFFGDDEDESPNWRARLGAILGGLAGTGLGGYVGYKRASTTLFEIQQALGRDYSLSGPDKSTMMLAVSQLSSSDQQLLAQLIRVAGTAMVGALIAKFLFKAGVGGSLLGAVLGGYAGSKMSGGASSLAGMKHNDKTDAYGNPYRL